MSMLNVEEPASPPDQPERNSIINRPQKKSPLKTFRGWIITIALCTLLLLLIVGILAMLTPSWYQPMYPYSDNTTNQADNGQALLLNLRNQFIDPKIHHPIIWTITQQQVDGLLATAVGEGNDAQQFNIDQHHGIVLSSPFVRFTDGAVTFAIRLENLPGSGVVSLTLSVHAIPALDPNGPAMGQIQIESVNVGSLPLPRSLVLLAIKEHSSQLTGPVERLITWFVGSKNAGSAGPVLVQDIQAMINGQTFPMQLKLGKRTLTIEHLEFRDSHVDESGVLQPASMTMEFTPSS
jgi:hypothetical protein